MRTRHLTSCVALFAALIAAARPAATQPMVAASPAIEPPASGSNPPARWYGTQILVLDVSVLAFALAAEDGAAVALALTGPTVHAIHGRWQVAAGSAVLRVFLPVLGMVAGNTICRERRGRPEQNDLGLGCVDYLGWGAITGYGIALAIDSSVLSFERAPRPSRAPAPIVQIGASSASIGVGLTF